MKTFFCAAASILLAGIIGALLFFLFVRNDASHHRTWDEIQKSGVLRVLAEPPPAAQGLMRNVFPRDVEILMLSYFAEQHGLRLEVVCTNSFAELKKALLDGKGDLIAANYSITPDRSELFLFTDPIRETPLVLVGREDGDKKQFPKVLIQRGTLYEQSIPLIRELYADCVVTFSDEDESVLLSAVSNGEYDFTLCDGDTFNACRKYASDVKIFSKLNIENRIAWALPRESVELASELNRCLRDRPRMQKSELARGDLPAIRDRGFLRVLTRNNSLNYYLRGDTECGFEYELAKRFADSLGLRLVMIVPPSHGELISWLIEGRGDLVAASWSATEQRSAIPGISFTIPYAETRELYLQHGSASPVQKETDLAGKTIFVREGTSYEETLHALQKRGIPLSVRHVSPEVESEEILSGVADGDYPCTVIDELIFRNARLDGALDELAVPLPLGEKRRYVWLVREKNPHLKAAADFFLAHELSTDRYAELVKKSFGPRLTELSVKTEKLSPAADGFISGTLPVSSAAVPEQTPEKKKSSSAAVPEQTKKKFANASRGVISRFDSLIQKVAKKFALDWRLVAAQVCQESAFNPDAVGPGGDAGLMQLMPAAIREMKCANPFNPQENLLAGVGYLCRQKSRLPAAVSPETERIYFALAAYNAGYGHVIDARRLASELGKNPDLWFGNTEDAMRLLARKKYYDRAKYGYCRSDLVIRYVRKIRDRWNSYRKIAEE